MEKKMKPSSKTLPETAIDNILLCLPLKSAAQTALISHSFLHRWRSIPNLDLSSIPTESITRLLHLHSGSIHLFKATLQSSDANADDVTSWLSLLSLHSSSTLTSLHLTNFNKPLILLHSLATAFPNLLHLHLSLCFLRPLINRLLRGREDSISFPCLRTLTLQNFKYYHNPHSSSVQISRLIPQCPLLESLTITAIPSSGGNNKFHWDLFSRSDLARIVELRLSDCKFEILPPRYSLILKYLKRVEVDRVMVIGQISSLFVICPALEELVMNNVRSEEKQRVVVFGDKIRSIQVVGNVELACFGVKSSPLLRSVVLNCKVCDFDERKGGCNMMKLLGNLGHVEELCLGDRVFKFVRRGNILEKLPMGLFNLRVTTLDVLEKLPMTFNNLRVMSLDVNLMRTKDLLITLCLLRSAPNIQELELKRSFIQFDYVLERAREFWIDKQDVEIFDRLQTLKMTKITDGGAELHFIQFVLAKAKVLHKIMIGFNKLFGFDLNKDSIFRKISEFPMVSDNVQILLTFSLCGSAVANADAEA